MDEQLRAEFDEWARDGRGESMEKDHGPVGKQAIALMQLSADSRVLDVGCGSGWATRLLAGYAFNGRATGIDISDEMIKLARKSSTSHGNVDFEVASAEQLPFPDNDFTHAFSMESLYYYPNIQEAISEVYRVLKNGGRFVAVVDLYQENEPTNYWIEKLAVRVHQLAISDYHTLFRRSGFAHVRDQRIVDPTPMTGEFPAKWFESEEAYQEYRENGALMMAAIAKK